MIAISTFWERQVYENGISSRYPNLKGFELQLTTHCE